MKIVLTKTAVKGLQRIPAKDRKAIIQKLNDYAANGSGDVIKMVGSDYYRLRSGDYRAIFEIVENIVVVRIAHRKHAYR